MKILAIDDEPEVLKQIEKVLASAKGPDNQPFDVTGLQDHREAICRLGTERFDIVVTDMYMGPEEDEGLGILEQLTDKSPITIILTGYPFFPTCVKSMRAGAWDYLEKVPEDGSDAYENLMGSIQDACRHRLADPAAGRAAADTRWVHDNIDMLMQKYPGETVAVLDQKVVGHDTNFSELAERMKNEFPLAKPAMISIPDNRVDAIE